MPARTPHILIAGTHTALCAPAKHREPKPRCALNPDFLRFPLIFSKIPIAIYFLICYIFLVVKGERENDSTGKDQKYCNHRPR